MINTKQIRRLANGTIDTNYYAQIGRQCRSETLYEGARAFSKFVSAAVRTIKPGWARPIAKSLGDTVAQV